MFLSIKSYSKESFLEFYKEIGGIRTTSFDNIVYDTVKVDGTRVTFYNNLTILFSGSIDGLLEEIKILIDDKLWVGSDEVGVGENIGPIIVCGVKFPSYENKIKTLTSASIKDSKKMTYEEVFLAADLIKKNAKVKCKVLPPLKFSELYKEINNVKAINAIMQNEIHVFFKDDKDHITDQFVNKTKYLEYLSTYKVKEVYSDLILETKAEEKVIEVGCAAIVAKSLYYAWILEYFERYKIPYKLGKRLDTNWTYQRIKQGKIVLKTKGELVKEWN